MGEERGPALNELNMENEESPIGIEGNRFDRRKDGFQWIGRTAITSAT